MKILFFIGTRPEAIKIAPLYIKYKKEFPNYDIKLCLTGQHNEMLWQVMEVFDLKADYSLDVMTKAQDLFSLSSKLISSIRDVLIDFNPNYVFVHGDTTTSFIASLCSFYNKSKICHVEAGLRTHQLFSPFPEEANRSLTARLADFHFAPSKLAKSNLVSEGINSNSILITGNTVIDALLMVSNSLESKYGPSIQKKFNNIDFSKKIILITSHRRENLEFGIKNVCYSIKSLAELYPEVQFVFPVHLNPRISNQVNSILTSLKNVFLFEPFNYIEFIFFMNRSYLIITDSGGIQEEAPILGKPVIITRDSTERPEAVNEGISFLLGADTNKIINKVTELLNDSDYYESIARPNYVYGDGKACDKIIDFFKKNIN